MAATLRDDATGMLAGIKPDTLLAIGGAPDVCGSRVLRVAHFLSRAKSNGDQ